MASGICQNIARGVATAPSMISVINHVTVIGSGLAGAGIAQVAAQTQHNVVLVDVSRDVLKTALANIKSSLQRIVRKQFDGRTADGEKFIEDTLSRVTFTPMDPEYTVRNADLVIDMTDGNLEERQKLFATLESSAPKHTIFATCSSAYSMSDVAALTARKDRFGGLHIFPPVPVMKLMEVIRIRETSDDTFNKLMDFARNVGKHPVACKDTPGYIADRLLVPYMAEAMKMIGRALLLRDLMCCWLDWWQEAATVLRVTKDYIRVFKYQQILSVIVFGASVCAMW